MAMDIIFSVAFGIKTDLQLKDNKKLRDECAVWIVEGPTRFIVGNFLIFYFKAWFSTINELGTVWIVRMNHEFLYFCIIKLKTQNKLK